MIYAEGSGWCFKIPITKWLPQLLKRTLRLPPENLGVSREEIRERVDNALETVGMTAFKRHAPHMLSGGQKQRVAIAGVLAMQPEILLWMSLRQ